jgi:phenylpyruvate tautomerase PptA (4-oxalocrotonate tautomerase family)
MPLLEFDCTASMTADEKQRFSGRTTELYADHMETGTDHIAVVLRERSGSELSIGRADSAEPCLVLDAEIRRGREFEAKRAFALAVMKLANEIWKIPDPNMKVVFTEHTGENMMGVERVGSEWSADGNN